MLILQGLPPVFGQPSGSPFVVKAMCLLNMAGVDWRFQVLADVRKAPRGKVPVLHDGDDVIHDSSLIRAHLETRHGADFDMGLSAEERAASHALIRMAEEHLYFAAVYNRWQVDANWEELRSRLFGALPPVVKQIAPRLVRRAILKGIAGQGMGRNTEAEVAERAAADLSAIRTVLGEKRFLYGDAPTAADASVGPMLATLIAGPNETLCSRLVSDEPALMSYLDRVQATLYPAPRASLDAALQSGEDRPHDRPRQISPDRSAV